MTMISGVQTRLKDIARLNCPCCNSPMYPPGLCPPVERRKTRGHLLPSSHRGVRFWVYQCEACNYDQDALSIIDWYERLEERGDRRAARVANLIDRLYAMGIFKLMGVEYAGRSVSDPRGLISLVESGATPDPAPIFGECQ